MSLDGFKKNLSWEGLEGGEEGGRVDIFRIYLVVFFVFWVLLFEVIRGQEGLDLGKLFFVVYFDLYEVLVGVDIEIFLSGIWWETDVFCLLCFNIFMFRSINKCFQVLEIIEIWIKDI